MPHQKNTLLLDCGDTIMRDLLGFTRAGAIALY